MKKSRIFILTAFSFFLFTSSVTFLSSCNKNTCEGISCKNGGSCSDGTCSCESGYYGALCENLERDKYIGRYEETGGAGSILNVSAGSGDFILNIQYESGNSIIVGNWTSSGATFPQQNIGGGVSVRNGKLSLNGTELTMTYESYFSGMGGGTWGEVIFVGERL